MQGPSRPYKFSIGHSAAGSVYGSECQTPINALGSQNQTDVPQPPKIESEAGRNDTTGLSRFLTGTPDMVMNWFSDITALQTYEVFGQMLSVIPGMVEYQNIMLIRGAHGPVMRIAYFWNDQVTITNYELGLWVRCVGHKHNATTLRAFSIRDATPQEVASLPRLCHLSEQVLDGRK